MASPAAAPQGDRTPAAGAVQAADFAELRSLIVGPEQRQLSTLQARLDDPAAQTRDVSRVLPQAMLLRKNDPQLTRALAPTVEEAITASVRRNPRPLADALFPIFGPAIRKAIAASLSGMLESLNRTLEHSLSWRAIQWRITALRTGKSFAEVVLLNTLVYRVEQVFLIERSSGLLLQHVTSGATGAQDADMVSGMLTAIRDFAHDSFRVSDDAALDTLQVGDLSVWIEQGPHAIVAAVIRGTAPQELRVTMQEAVEHVHARLGETLAAFDGDTAPFDAVRPALETCLQTRYRSERKKASPVLWMAVATVVLAVAVWAFFSLSARARWNRYLQALRAEPGIVVVSEDRNGGKFAVTGLRDPLAPDPASMLAAAGISADDVTAHWQLYQALEPRLIAARARQLLRAPDAVTLEFADGVLTAGGTAPVSWIVDSRRIANLVPGVVRYDAGPLIDAQVRSLAQQLEASPLLFVRGSTAFETGGEQGLRAQGERLRDLDALAQASGRRYRIEITGHADTDGPPESNDPLSVQRATRVRAAFAALGLRQIDLSAAGLGSRQPLSPNTTEADKRANRRVALRVVPAGAPPGKPAS
ncbi:MAG TPA: OmpA family protein [Vicinamibacterales bacterium]|nr:OmpA family protein [Vicinamibacterales bacterium]